MFHYIIIGKCFLKKTAVAQEIILSIDKWEYMKLKAFCKVRKKYLAESRDPAEWAKIPFPNTYQTGDLRLVI